LLRRPVRHSTSLEFLFLIAPLPKARPDILSRR
jgi:hypothetical protein